MTRLIRVVARRGACGTVVPELRGTVPWRPRLMAGGAAPGDGVPGATGGTAASVLLVQTGACLLAGDDVRIEVEVEAGARLEIRELGATIAHHVRGGRRARLAIEIIAGPRARLAWAAAPVISSAGSHLQRTLNVALGADATALLRETTVFGRTGETAGVIESIVRATTDGGPLLHERLTTADAALAASPVVAGGARQLDAVLLLGRPAPEPEAGDPERGVMRLAGPGAIWRALSRDGAGGLAAGDLIWERWLKLPGAQADTRPPETVNHLIDQSDRKQAHLS